MLGSLRRSEWVLGAFFFYIAILGAWRNQGVSVRVVAAALIPLALVVAARADSFSVRSGWSVARDWIPAVLVLVAYWSIDWVPTAPPNRELEGVLIVWDRAVLYDWGLRAANERFGVLVPAILELAYLVLYAVLPLSIAGF